MAERLHVEYYCRTCHRRETTPAIPLGWYGGSRHRGDGGPPQALGLYCSLACVLARVPELRAEERKIGETFVGVK